jgi:hypothetical protein
MSRRCGNVLFHLFIRRILHIFHSRKWAVYCIETVERSGRWRGVNLLRPSVAAAWREVRRTYLMDKGQGSMENGAYQRSHASEPGMGASMRSGTKRPHRMRSMLHFQCSMLTYFWPAPNGSAAVHSNDAPQCPTGACPAAPCRSRRRCPQCDEYLRHGRGGVDALAGEGGHQVR